MSDKIEAWCVVTEGDAFAVRPVTLVWNRREFMGSGAIDVWEPEGDIQPRWTGATEADAREWVAEEIRIRLGMASEDAEHWQCEITEVNERLAAARGELDLWKSRAVAAGVSLEAIP